MQRTVEQTFTLAEDGSGRYTSICDPEKLCPPLIIAEVALSRVVDKQSLQLPEDYNGAELYNAVFKAGDYVKSSIWSHQHASEFGYIGQQLLTLDEAGGINPPLNDNEKQSIAHLVAIAPAFE